MTRADNPFVIARREGFRSGVFVSAWVCTAIAFVIMTVLHMALMMRSDASHEESMALLRVESQREITALKRDLARFNDIAQLERDVVAHEVGR